MPGPSKDVIRHLDDDGLDEAITAAQTAGDARLVRRLCFVKNLYAGDSITAAADRVGVTQPTGSRWVEAWNDGGIEGLEPDFGGGRPPKLGDTERARFAAVVERHGPLTIDGIRTLLEAGFGVTYSRRHLTRLLGTMGIEHVVAEPGGSSRSDDTDVPTEENVQAALADLEDAGTDTT